MRFINKLIIILFSVFQVLFVGQAFATHDVNVFITNDVKGEIEPGQVITYSVKVSDIGPHGADKVKLVAMWDDPDNIADFVSASGDAIVNAEAGKISWWVDDEIDEPQTFQFKLQIHETNPTDGKFEIVTNASVWFVDISEISGEVRGKELGASTDNLVCAVRFTKPEKEEEKVPEEEKLPEQEEEEVLPVEEGVGGGLPVTGPNNITSWIISEFIIGVSAISISYLLLRKKL